jgi:hypothetical protein
MLADNRHPETTMKLCCKSQLIFAVSSQKMLRNNGKFRLFMTYWNPLINYYIAITMMKLLNKRM